MRPVQVTPLRKSGGLVDAPGRGLALADAAELGVTSYVRCEVEGSGISKSKTLVTLCVIPSAPIDCLAAVTAP